MVTVFLYPVKEQDQGVPNNYFISHLWGEIWEILARVLGYFSSWRHGNPQRTPSKTRMRVRHAESMQYASNSITDRRAAR